VDRHLNDAELNEALAGNLPLEIVEHLNACVICRSSRDDMEYLFRTLNAEADTLAEKPDAFWLAQRRQINNRAPESHSILAPRFAWAGLAATVILAVTLLMRSGPAVKTHTPQVIAENDQQLMVDVEQTLDSNLAPPLEPTGALVEAMTQTTSSRSQSATKEKLQ
jgi:predicted anti-sigma-YlaC factor YlaD